MTLQAPRLQTATAFANDNRSLRTPDEPPQRGALAPWQLKRAVDLIDSRLDASLRVGELAAAVRLSSSYFCQAFRGSVGQSPHAYLQRRRIERAKELMLSTDKTLAEIAVDCGLTDQPHLTRLFRRHVGMTPATWRRWRAMGDSVR